MTFKVKYCISTISDKVLTILTFVKITFAFYRNSSVGKESACNVGDLGSIPGLGRSPREGKGYPHGEYHGKSDRTE